MGRLACSSSLRHCLPESVSGARCASAPGCSARKAMPRTSAATASRSASLARPAGGTRCTRSSPWPMPSSASSAARKSPTVALTAHSSSVSSSGRCTAMRRRRVLGGTASRKMPLATSALPAPSSSAKAGPSSMTSRSSASSRATSRRGMELEVFRPCCTCRQMPKSSWNSATVMSPFFASSCFTKLKSSPMFTSPYGSSSAALRR
mmetsp:Transcript_111982/g.361539  ORF Transcript_111982/g.361539 Transcript_111982/m.361539 type:complete len:206 (-) Transcript_111982:25-642(-)